MIFVIDVMVLIKIKAITSIRRIIVQIILYGKPAKAGRVTILCT